MNRQDRRRNEDNYIEGGRRTIKTSTAEPWITWRRTKTDMFGEAIVMIKSVKVEWVGYQIVEEMTVELTENEI